MIKQLHAGATFNNVDPTLKRVYSPDRFVSGWSRGEPTSWEVREAPFDAVETVAVIDHGGRIVLCSVGAREHDLATIAIARPFVENKHRDKFSVVYDPVESAIRQKTLNCEGNADTIWPHLRRKSRAETRSWTTGNISSPDLDREIVSALDEKFGHVHDSASTNRKA